jgi:hypothetical protein
MEAEVFQPPTGNHSFYVSRERLEPGFQHCRFHRQIEPPLSPQRGQPVTATRTMVVLVDVSRHVVENAARELSDLRMTIENRPTGPFERR